MITWLHKCNDLEPHIFKIEGEKLNGYIQSFDITAEHNPLGKMSIFRIF